MPRKPKAKPIQQIEIIEADGLTIKQRLFIDHYIVCMNGTEAARLAGYEGDTATLAVMASQNLRNHNVLRNLNTRLESFAMSANEVLIHLTDIARGDIADTLDSSGGIDPLEAKRRGKSHLIKRFKTKQITSEDQDIYETEVEMYDRLDALKTLAKFHSLLIDRVKVDDWRSDVIALLRDGLVTIDAVREEFGSDIAQELSQSISLPSVDARENESVTPAGIHKTE